MTIKEWFAMLKSWKQIVNEIKWQKLRWELRNVEPYDYLKERNEKRT